MNKHSLLSFLLALMIGQTLSAQQYAAITPLNGSSVNRNTLVTVGFSVNGVVYLNGAPFTIAPAEFVVAPTITITGGTPTSVTANCATLPCSFSFTPTTNGSTMTVAIGPTTADMEYDGPSIAFSAKPVTGILLTYAVSGPLAAEMLHFTGTSSKTGKVDLSWATASEKDNNKFVVEQSVNGIDFKAIGEVKGAGTSQTENRYSFTDENPSKAINYYRLKTIDNDGAEALSKVVAIANKGAFDAKATASVQGAKVSIIADQDGEATLDILNLNGQIVSTQSVAVTNGVSEYVLPFNQTGLFIVRVSNGKSSVSTKLMKY